MNDRGALIAFCAVLLAICYIATFAAILAYQRRYAEALGFGGLTTGLVGVLGTFRPSRGPAASVGSADSVTVTQPGDKEQAA